MARLLLPLMLFAAVPLQDVTVDDERAELDRAFQNVVSPFLISYCTTCHGKDKPKAKFDLSPYVSLDSVVGDMGHWEIVLERLRAGEMPAAKPCPMPA